MEHVHVRERETTSGEGHVSLNGNCCGDDSFFLVAVVNAIKITFARRCYPSGAACRGGGKGG